MRKKITSALFFYLIIGFTCFAYSPHGSNFYVGNTPSSSEEIVNINSSSNFGPNDFIIRKKADFNNHPIGSYTNAQFRSDWESGDLYQPNTSKIQLVNGKKVLANYYPKGKWGGRGSGLNQFINLYDGPDIEELYLTYNIKFEKDFDWAILGKLPGFSFGPVQTVAGGGAGPNLGNKGASLRLLWDDKGKMRFYVYHHNMSGKYGDNMGISPFGQFKKDQWHELTFRVVGNTVGSANGIMQVWLDGILVASATNVEMRTSSSPKTIREVILSTFMGGGDSRFAPDRNQHMWMDDFHIWHYSDEFLKSNSSVARGRKLHPSSQDLYTPLSGNRIETPTYDYIVSTNSNPSNGGYIKFEQDQNEYKAGEKVILTATANSGFKFSNWTIDGKEVGKDEFYQFTMPSKNVLLKANFYKVTAIPPTSTTPTTPTTPTSPSNSELKNGLISIYEMNTNSSNILKDSHGQNDGVNTRITHVSGFIGKGNHYDGNSHISEVPNDNSLNLNNEFTLMADVYLEGNGQSGTSIIVGKENLNRFSQDYSLGITSRNKVRIRAMLPNLTDWVFDTTVPQDKWVRIIATYKSGEGFRLYLDDIEQESSPPYKGTISKSGRNLYIGSNTNEGDGAAANNRRFEGKLDNVGIWNRQLSEGEISELIETKITYPDFGGNEYYRITTLSTVDNIPENTIIIDSTRASKGEKLIFLGDNEEDLVFDHWSIDGVPVSDQSIMELEMQNKDILLTKHYRTFIAPEVKILLPEDKLEFEASSKIHIDFDTKNHDAKIEKVELFNGDELLGETTQESSGLDWQNIPEGNHELTAKITDSNGNSYLSDPVVLKVVDSRQNDFNDILLRYVIGPNPTLDYLNIIFSNLDGVYDFEFNVVSMNGSVKKKFKTTPIESSVTLDVSDLQNGVYILQVSANGNSISNKRFIKK